MEEEDGVKAERSKEHIAEDALEFIPEIQKTFHRRYRKPKKGQQKILKQPM